MFATMLSLHVLAAAIWTGGHLVLAVVVLPRVLREKDVAGLLRFEGAYEKIGLPALLVQVATGPWLAYRWVPDPARWLSFADPVSRGVGLKMVLLAATVAFALDARLRLLPRLDAERLAPLAWHIVPVTVLSVLFVLVGVAFRTGGVGG